MIASFWGNKNIDNENLIEEKESYTGNVIDNSSFILDDSDAGIMLLKNNLIENNKKTIDKI